MKQSDREHRIQTTCLLILTAIALTGALAWLRPVLVPFVLSIFFSLALVPVIDAQIRWLRLPRPLALLGTMLLGLGILVLLSALISSSANRMSRDLPRFESNFLSLLDKTSQSLQIPALANFVAEERAYKEQGDAPPEEEEAVPTILTKKSSPLRQLLKGKLTQSVSSAMSAITSLLSQGVLVLIFMLFLLMGRSMLTGEVDPKSTWGEIEQRVKGYILTKIVTSTLTGVLVGVSLAIIGVPLAGVFGLTAFLLNFIPSIGSIIATIVPIIWVLGGAEALDASVLTKAALALAIPGGIQFLVGNVLEPKMLGQSLELHPVVILITLIFWGMLWGTVGMLLATPITAVIKILLEKMERTAPFARALEGRFDNLTDQGR